MVQHLLFYVPNWADEKKAIVLVKKGEFPFSSLKNERILLKVFVERRLTKERHGTFIRFMFQIYSRH